MPLRHRRSQGAADLRPGTNLKNDAPIFRIRARSFGEPDMKPQPNPLFRAVIQLGGDLKGAPTSSDTAAQAALALATALLQALRDRGVLSRDELDDVLADAASRIDYGSPSCLIERAVGARRHRRYRHAR